MPLQRKISHEQLMWTWHDANKERSQCPDIRYVDIHNYFNETSINGF